MEQLNQRKQEENNAVEGLLKRQNDLLTTINGLEGQIKNVGVERDHVCGEIEVLREE